MTDGRLRRRVETEVRYRAIVKDVDQLVKTLLTQRRLIAKTARLLQQIDDGLMDGSLEAAGLLEFLSGEVRPLIIELEHASGEREVTS